ncbi:tRNA preQ1(34) S-adenosylmethionine ribosyltransferase-isomerase QueA [Aristophania vespae]|uniref:S-adenosylmethionine:tRNA ribosyltransferase-isomerase n=1 Tax=Aristophania vespae TaxID=2697033 RepID=A0A6P1NF45_9PROT|nr:tRNA preQ1(34) S-adenosylmethionine ribosyltransferase-isomerase QueA [Aristophania vespae]QHI95943.1 tRNA preQ1(34) S-adenosylmethionine ribosyltransferase-isomerase QueA [Aristophania vespae]
MTDDLTLFDFHLPHDHIATEPARPREAAKLLRVDPHAPFNEQLQHDIIRNLPCLVKENDLIVANNTEVIKAKFEARRGEAKIGITLDRILPEGTWHALARNARRLHKGDELHFGNDETVIATVIDNEGDGAVTLRFSVEGDEFDQFLERRGILALPPYIARPNGPTMQDNIDYKTIFSRFRGAVAAPTAGLHFTEDLLEALRKKNIRHCSLTLHVGAGTFLPVRSTIAEHKMHAEWGHIDSQTAQLINETKAKGGRIMAIGTTTLRLLESAATEEGLVEPWSGETSIFIKPGYRFKVVDRLLTNFHLPRSTLFMLVCAFSGTETMRRAYELAVKENYRFYSYGDACLLERQS